MSFIPVAMPEGAQTDLAVTFTLADIQREFPQRTSYFATPTVVCLQDPYRPYANEICSTQAPSTPWVSPTSGWSTAPYRPPVPHLCATCGHSFEPPIVSAVPEPSMGLLVAAMLLIVAWRRR